MGANPQLDQSFSSAKLWREEANKLRGLLLACDLTEELKWGKPCYTDDGKNIVIIQRMSGFLALLFFKGGMLTDPAGILEKQGPNSKAGYRMRFSKVQDILDIEKDLHSYIREAIEVERSGRKIEAKAKLELPGELATRFDSDPDFKTAFDELTPGRQRGYALYFAQPKQSETRTARIEKHRQKILAGKGVHDR